MQAHAAWVLAFRVRAAVLVRMPPSPSRLSLLLLLAVPAVSLCGQADPSLQAMPEMSEQIRLASRQPLEQALPSAIPLQMLPRAQKGDAEAQCAMALCLDLGIGLRIDPEAALEWLNKAAAQNHPAARAYLAWRQAARFPEAGDMDLKEDKPKALPNLKGTVRSTPVKLQEHLARWMTTEGGTCSPQFRQHLKRIQQQAERGDPVAMANLARISRNSFWGQPSKKQHLDWLEKAAGAGDLPSLLQLSLYLENGITLSQDPDKPRTLLARMAGSGDRKAEAWAGLILLAKAQTGDHYREACGWLRNASRKGNAEARLKLMGILYNGAPGVPKDMEEVRALGREGWKLGQVEPALMLAGMLERGEGGPQDPAGALEIYVRLSRENHPLAVTSIGRLHHAGAFGEPDLQQALYWFGRGADLGNAYSMRMLGEMHTKGLGTPANPIQARLWYEKAAKAGDGEAKHCYGKLLKYGIGGERNSWEAAKWLQAATFHGITQARLDLATLYLGDGDSKVWDPAQAFDYLSVYLKDEGSEQAVALFTMIFNTPEQTASLGPRLQELASDPELMTSKGWLPEACFMALGRTRGSAAKLIRSLLLDALEKARRPQSAETLARCAFLGDGLPYSPEKALAYAALVSPGDPKHREFVFATITSICGKLPEERENAWRELEKLAREGRVEAQQILAYRQASAEGLPTDCTKYDEWCTKYAVKKAQDGGVGDAALPAAVQQQLDEGIRQRETSGGDVPVKVIHQAKPHYPMSLRQAWVEGEATVIFIVNQDGSTSDFSIKETTHPFFSEAAIRAVAQWKFLPQKKSGRLVRTRMAVPVRFSLSDT